MRITVEVFNTDICYGIQLETKLDPCLQRK